MNSTLQLIKSSILQEKTCNWSILSETNNTINLKVSFVWIRGRSISYEITIQINESDNILNKVQVRESDFFKYKKLPNFCPQRHINKNGFFCLGFYGIDNLLVESKESSNRWIERLILYLKLQEKASVLKKWDSDKEWMHGDAAKYQNIALNSALFLGDFYIKSLNEKTMISKFFRRNGLSFLVVSFLNSELKYKLNLTEKRIVSFKTDCPLQCQSKNKIIKRIARCKDHSKHFYNLGWAHYQMNKEEEKFWMSWIDEGVVCCGVCTSCGLKRGES